MALEPSDDELLEFVNLLLSNHLDAELRDPDVLAQAISEKREMWVSLYRMSRGFEGHESHASQSGEQGSVSGA